MELALRGGVRSGGARFFGGFFKGARLHVPSRRLRSPRNAAASRPRPRPALSSPPRKRVLGKPPVRAEPRDPLVGVEEPRASEQNRPTFVELRRLGVVRRVAPDDPADASRTSPRANAIPGLGGPPPVPAPAVTLTTRTGRRRRRRRRPGRIPGFEASPLPLLNDVCERASSARSTLFPRARSIDRSSYATKRRAGLVFRRRPSARDAGGFVRDAQTSAAGASSLPGKSRFFPRGAATSPRFSTRRARAHDRWAPRLVFIAAGARAADARRVEGVEGVGEAFLAPVEDVVVREGAEVDARGEERVGRRRRGGRGSGCPCPATARPATSARSPG